MVEFAKSIELNAKQKNSSVNFDIADIRFDIIIGVFETAYVCLNFISTSVISEKHRIAYVELIKGLLPSMFFGGPLATKCNSLTSAEKLMKKTIECLGMAKDKFEEIKKIIITDIYD